MNMNADLGADADLLTLVSKIKGFDYEMASPTESMALARALKLVAEDIVTRHTAVLAMQKTLAEKIEMAEVAGELAGVIEIIRPRKRGWFTRTR
jgi:hypothetical protein